MTKVCYNKDGGGGPFIIKGPLACWRDLKIFLKNLKKGVDKWYKLCYNKHVKRERKTIPENEEEETMMNELTALTAFDVYGEDVAELMAELMADPEYIRMMEEDLQKQLG